MAARNSQLGESDSVSQRFTGKERDTETSLDFFGARYYALGIERFMSPDETKGGFDDLDGQAVFEAGTLPYADISDPQTLNKYGYVRNNRLRYIDPKGHQEQEPPGREEIRR